MTKNAPREDCLLEAIELTTGDRFAAYGDPVDAHQHIADIFNAITGRNITAREVALLHQCTKIRRRWQNPLHRDSYVDGAAYTAIEYECALRDAKSAEGELPG